MDRASWLLKALHEASGEVQEALLAADRGRYDSDLAESAWDLAVHERSTGWHVEQVLRGRDQLTLHPAEWLSTGVETSDVADLVRIYGRSRSETCGLLWGLPPDYLERGAQHPFRGTVSLEDLFVALHERDIETMLALQRISAPAPLGPGERPRGTRQGQEALASSGAC